MSSKVLQQHKHSAEVGDVKSLPSLQEQQILSSSPKPPVGCFTFICHTQVSVSSCRPTKSAWSKQSDEDSDHEEEAAPDRSETANLIGSSNHFLIHRPSSMLLTVKHEAYGVDQMVFAACLTETCLSLSAVSHSACVPATFWEPATTRWLQERAWRTSIPWPSTNL